MYYTAHKTSPFNTIFKPVFDEIVHEINKYENIGRPAANIVDNDTNYEIHLFVPGYHKTDFSIELKDDKLIVASEKKSDGSAWKVEEYKINPFSRSFVLPKEVDQSNVSATYENGILTVVLNKSKETQARTIEIK